MRIKAVGVISLALFCAGVNALDYAVSDAVPTPPWSKAKRPSRGVAQSIGGYSSGCLQGAVSLPERGPGFKSIRRHRRRYFGHPSAVKLIKRIGAQVKRAGLKPIEIGDISQPRGGSMSYGHKSHQIGLDIDVWFGGDARYLERVAPQRRRRVKARKLTQRQEKSALFNVTHPSLIKGRDEEIDDRVWSTRHEKLLELAARQPEVARIFIHFRIKERMCAVYRARPEAERDPAPLWLRKLRPWYGHHQHFHIRLHCPEGSAECDAQGPLPSGPGCEGLAWFSNASRAKRKREKRREERAEEKRRAKLPRAERSKIARERSRARAQRQETRRAAQELLQRRCGHLTPGRGAQKSKAPQHNKTKLKRAQKSEGTPRSKRAQKSQNPKR